MDDATERPIDRLEDMRHSLADLGIAKVRGPYGPYVGKNNRRYVEAVFADGTTKLVTYARMLVALDRGAFPSAAEHVHHVNEDPLDDRLANYDVLSNNEHAHLHASQLITELWHGNCGLCGVEMVRPARDVRRNQGKRACSGPYCSRRCPGRASHLLDVRAVAA